MVDGTGADRFRADVAVDGEQIVAVSRPDGEPIGPGRREIDADGLIVTPGWVDIHTHYDGQITWDPELAPSSVNGVTSILVGNCGVGFAPVAPDRHQFLIELLEGVEDIPGTALTEGMTWGWETFPEYLDLLDTLRWSIDVGTQVPHAALRTYVMGERGADVEAVASPDEIADDVGDCARRRSTPVRSGSPRRARTCTAPRAASRSARSRAGTDEVLGIAAALRRAGAGVIQLISDAYQSTDDELVANEIELLGRIATEVGRPLSFTVQQNDDAPDRFRELLAAIDRWNAAGADVKAQVAVRPIGVLIGLQATANPFMFCPSYRQLHTLTARRAARPPPRPRDAPQAARRARRRRPLPASSGSCTPATTACTRSPTHPTTSRHPPTASPAAPRQPAPGPTSCSTTCCSTTTAAACSTSR